MNKVRVHCGSPRYMKYGNKKIYIKRINTKGPFVQRKIIHIQKKRVLFGSPRQITRFPATASRNKATDGYFFFCSANASGSVDSAKAFGDFISADAARAGAETSTSLAMSSKIWYGLRRLGTNLSLNLAALFESW